MEPTNAEILFVSNSTHAASLGSAVAHAVYEQRPVLLRAIGAGSISQAVKAIAVARKYVAERGDDILVKIDFTNVSMPDKIVTAMTFEVVTWTSISQVQVV
jgi:stage V sporulation protein SpoVS